MKWLELHPKVKAAALTLAGIAVVEAIAVLNGTMTFNQAAGAFVVAALPVLTAYLKGTPVPDVLDENPTSPHGDEVKTEA